MTTLYQRSWPQMNETPDSLLATDEPPPFTVDNENGTSAAPHRRRSRGEAFSAAAWTARPFQCRMRASHCLGHRRRRGLLPDRKSAQCRRRSAELFPIGYRLQPNAGVGDVNPRPERVDACAGKHRPKRTSQARARSGDIPALSRSHRNRARSATRRRPTDSLDFRAQLHTRFQDRCAALACRRAL
jgi:hypothetical protein